jgi:cell division GTPase FtsZ
MTKIIGIGSFGNNILEFLKKQNYQVKRDLNYEFISIDSDDDIASLENEEDDIIFTISGLGGNTSGNLTINLTKNILEQYLNVKNIIILPFSIDTSIKKNIQELEQLISINQNVEVFSNDDISNENNLDKPMSELMRVYDLKIFDRITKKNQINWRSFFISTEVNDVSYKAVVTFWSKDYKVTLLEPEYKILDASHMPYMAPSRFAFHDEDRSTSSIMNIEEIASKILNNYGKGV